MGRLILITALAVGCSAERSRRGASDPPGGGEGSGAEGGDEPGGDLPEEQGQDGGGEEGEGEVAPGGDGDAGGGPAGIPEDEDSAPCRVLVECILGCSDGACETSCQLRASDEAKAVWEDMKTCAADKGCEVTDFDCMMNSCSEPSEACMQQGGDMGGPGGDGEPPELGDSACAEVMECSAACRAEGCEDACHAEAGDDARPALAEFLACQNMVCDGRLPCIQAECQGALDACTQDEDVTLGCGGLLVCVVFLCQGDIDCIQPCYDLVADAVYETFDALQQCVFQACGQPDMECAQQQCPQQYAACTGGEVEQLPDGLTCGGVVECLGGCLSEAQARECRRSCEDRADASAYDALDGLLDCMLDADCPDFDFECGQERCPEELGVCQGHVLE